MNTTSVPYLDLDDISLEERIGRGTFPVFRATMKGQVMAVKKMDCDRNELPHEVQVHNNLPPHPNVLPLLGVAHSKDGFDIHLCMPLADKSLHQYLHKEKYKPSLQKSKKWALQVAKGMHHLHQHGLAHGNLKPKNVLLFEWGNTIRVCDFGSTRANDHTLSGEPGNARWTAPEFNYKASTRVLCRCDVFSYGMIMYEIFTHRIPFYDIYEDMEVVSRIRDGERPSISPQLSRSVHKLIQSCWTHNPSDRPTFERIVQVHTYIRPHKQITSYNVDNTTCMYYSP